MALTQSQITSRLFKKSIGRAETTTDFQYSNEPINGRPSVFSDQIWSQSNLIPNDADPSLEAGAPTIGSSYSVGVVKYYNKLTLSTFITTGNQNVSFYSDDLKDSIPFTFGNGSYTPLVYKSDGVTEIPFGLYDHLIDSEAGVLTFYSTSVNGVSLSSYGVNVSNPPIISFYKYIGEKGVSTTSGSMIGVTAGNGLSGGGTSSYITLDVNVSNGLIINGDNIEIDPLAAGSGLTFSSGSIDLVWGGTTTGLTVSTITDAVGVVVDGTTIQINGYGQLTVVSGASTPVYDRVNSFITSGNDQSTGMVLTQNPNDYSRIQVYVNGQLQRLGNGVTTNVDCYISSTPSVSENLVNIYSGQQLYWNGTFANFDLSTTDIIEIIYES